MQQFIRQALFTLGLILAVSGQASAQLVTNTHPIEGYVDNVNLTRGGTATFYVHAPHAYDVTFIRYGPNDSNGTSTPQPITPTFRRPGGAQPYDTLAFASGAGWPSSFSTGLLGLDTTAWTSGIYAAELEDSVTRDDFFVTFVVEDPAGSEKSIALVASTNTWQAYNFWPANAYGGSFYDSRPNGCGTPFADSVSFLRPNPYASPLHVDAYNCFYPPFERTWHLAAGEIRIARWLERNGYAYSMLTDAGIDQKAPLAQLNVYKAVILSTHSEYWTQHMYDVLSAYEKAGGNVVDLSGNTAYRQVTTCWAGCSTQSITKVGPFYGDNGATWSPDQQAAVLGVQSLQPDHGPSTTQGRCQPFSVNKASHWLFAGIPVSTGTLIGTAGEFSTLSACGADPPQAAGSEVDRAKPVFARQYSDLATATLTGPANTSYSDLVYMRKASAGQVFAAPSITFGQSLMADSKLPAGSQKLTPLLKNVLGKFQTRSFSDFDGNGTTDVIGRDASGALVRYDGDGQGNFAPTGGIQFDSGWSGMRFIVNVGDFGGSGHSDLVALDGSGTLRRYKGDGVGGLVQDGGTVIATGWGAYSQLVSPGDFNGDGIPDLLAVDSAGLWLIKGDGRGGVQPGRTQVGSSGWNGCRTITPGDFDRDGNADLMCLDGNGTLWLYKGDGSGGWISPNGTVVASALTALTAMVDAGDFTGTGTPALLGRDTSGNLTLYTRTPDGMLAASTSFGGGWNTYNLLLGVW